MNGAILGYIAGMTSCCFVMLTVVADRLGSILKLLELERKERRANRR